EIDPSRPGRANPAPQAPVASQLTFQYDGTLLHIRWNAPADDNADSTSLPDSLYYSVKVKSDDGNTTFLSGADGSPMLGGLVRPAKISGQYDLALRGLPAGGAVYRVQVRAIDSSLQPGAWSNERTVPLYEISAPRNVAGHADAFDKITWSWDQP